MVLLLTKRNGEIKMLITNTEQYRIIALHKMLKLELLGMKHSRGSAYKTLKEMFNLKGNKQKVFDQVEELLN
jgi:hypothetical protein